MYVRALLCALLAAVPASAPQAPALAPAAEIVSQQCRKPGPDPDIPATSPPNSTYLTSVAPPARFGGDAKVEIRLVSKEEANRICAGGTPVCGRVFYACASGNKLVMPNPCQYSMDDPYAKLFCHEVAHVNGWPASHGD